jgi:catechol 2,3-dioxygenase-like lactoylglutathione lyase family enzyme
MIKNIRHAAIVVSDLSRTRIFYEEFFGFKLVKEDIETGPFIEKVVGISNVKIHWVKLRTPNGVIIELLKYISPENKISKEQQVSNHLGHSHLAFTVESMNDFIERFLAIGGKMINSPMMNPEKTALVCYVFDPEENLLEIVEEI